MPNRTEIAFSASARALRDLIIPALDDTNATAREQASVIADLLAFSADRAHHEYSRKRFELDCYMSMASRLVDNGTVDPASVALRDRIHNCAIATTHASFDELQSTIDELTDGISDLLADPIVSCTDEVKRRRRVVVDETTRLIAMQRSWFGVQGFDPSGDDLPSIYDVLFTSGGQASHSATTGETSDVR